MEGKLPKTLKIRLKYRGQEEFIEGLKRVSTPGLRRYVGATEIPRVLGRHGRGHRFHFGRFDDRRRRPSKKNLGGEVLCYIW